MSTRKTHYDIALYGLTMARRSRCPLNALLRISKRNRTLAERHGHDWRTIRRECVAQLRRVDAARRRLNA